MSNRTPAVNEITARDVKVGDTIATRSHVFPLTITAREVRHGVIWLKYANQTGKTEWHNAPPEEVVTILDRKFTCTEHGDKCVTLAECAENQGLVWNYSQS